MTSEDALRLVDEHHTTVEVFVARFHRSLRPDWTYDELQNDVQSFLYQRLLGKDTVTKQYVSMSVRYYLLDLVRKKKRYARVAEAALTRCSSFACFPAKSQELKLDLESQITRYDGKLGASVPFLLQSMVPGCHSMPSCGTKARDMRRVRARRVFLSLCSGEPRSPSGRDIALDPTVRSRLIAILKEC